MRKSRKKKDKVLIDCAMGVVLDKFEEDGYDPIWLPRGNMYYHLQDWYEMPLKRSTYSSWLIRIEI